MGFVMHLGRGAGVVCPEAVNVPPRNRDVIILMAFCCRHPLRTAVNGLVLSCSIGF